MQATADAVLRLSPVGRGELALGLGGKLGGAAAEARRAGLVAWRPWSGTFRGPAGLMPLLLPINQFGMTFKSLCVYTYITSRVPCEGVGGTSWAGAWHIHGHGATSQVLSQFYEPIGTGKLLGG